MDGPRPICDPLRAVVLHLTRVLDPDDALAFLLAHFPGAVVEDEGVGTLDKVA
jgi:hypothetical protein